MTGMIEGHFGFEIFDSGMFLGRKIGQVFLGVAVARFKKGFFGGIQNNLKICGSARASRPGSSANIVEPNKVHVTPFNVFWKFLRLGSAACDFFVFNFCPWIFWGFCWKPQGFFWGGGGFDCLRDSFGF